MLPDPPPSRRRKEGFPVSTCGAGRFGERRGDGVSGGGGRKMREQEEGVQSVEHHQFYRAFSLCVLLASPSPASPPCLLLAPHSSTLRTRSSPPHKMAPQLGGLCWARVRAPLPGAVLLCPPSDCSLSDPGWL